MSHGNPRPPAARPRPPVEGAAGTGWDLAMQRAEAFYRSGQWDKTEELCKRALAVRPDHFEALILLGIIAAQTARLQDAAVLLGRAVRIRPADAGAHNNVGNVLLALGRIEEALQSFTRALQLDPRHAEAHNNRGTALQQLKRLIEALESFDRSLRVKPDFAQAHDNRGLVLYRMGRFSEALASHERALELAPRSAEAHRHRGDALHALRRPEEALASFDRALALDPQLAAAHCNRGAVLHHLRRLDEAMVSYELALEINSDFVEAHNNRGNVLQDLHRPSEAVASYDRAINLNSEFAAAHHNRGTALIHLNRLDEALQSYDLALSLDPNYPWLHGVRLFTKARLCDWRNWSVERAALAARIDSGGLAARPFHVQALTDSEALQRRAAEIFARHECPSDPARSGIRGRAPHGKIRVGYFSADYRAHPVAVLCAGLIEAHDRSRFEISAFSFGRNTQDGLRRRLERAFDRFLDVRTKSDQDVADMARRLGLDIAVDLTGFTDDARPGVFALRAAPLQVSFLGYPGTMGTDFIDYLIADRIVLPDSSRPHYREKIIYMPHSYLVNDSSRSIADRPVSRIDQGLPESGFVYCCFNNSYKITSATFDCWMRILARVEGSVLWLAAGCPAMTRNLRREAEDRGVSAGRLVFADRLESLSEHLARHRAADLALDTLPYNGHTTTADALWAGLPVLTRMGPTFPGRVSGSLLHAIGLPELVAADQERYEELAVELARQPGRLAALRQKLADHRLTTAAFDTRLYTKDLESAYAGIHRRSLAGLAPEDVHA